MKQTLPRILVSILLTGLIHSCVQDDNGLYNEFYQQVQENEPYIGFFAAEKKYISEITGDYLEARRTFFIGVSQCKEDPEEFGEPFVEFCLDNNLLKEEDVEAWEKVLTILSYELYANMPIFEFSTDRVIEHRSIVYAEYPNKKLELDLFIPKEPVAEPMPVVVCMHGGGYVVNRRIWFEPFAKYLASKGLAAVTIDYRKIPAVTIKECIYDSKAAVRWVRAHAAEYGIDPERIGAIGASAGAHAVALLATTGDVPELEGAGGNQGVSSKIQAVVGIATPANKMNGHSERAERHGLTEEEFKLLSPYENASESSAPLFLIHGTADETVDPQNAQDLYDRYKEFGVHVELKWIPEEGHGFYEGTDMAIEMASDFFLKQLCNNGLSEISVLQTVDGEEIEREVLIHAPESIDTTRSYPVVMAFHGNGGVNDHWVGQLGEFVNSGEFIGVYPQGHFRSWNLGHEKSTADDVEFADLIVERLNDIPHLDMDRLYAIGYSNGSGMVNLLGAETGHFRAIACCATQLIKGQEPGERTRPLSVYQLCGTADDIIPYDGGLSPVGHTFLSAKESAERWASLFHCSPVPEVKFINGDSLFIYPDCRSGREIRFHRVEDAGHGLHQENDQGFYARIWAFLKAQ